MLTNTASTYGSVSKFLHWLIFLLVTGMLIFGFFLDDIPKDYQGMAYSWHKGTGLTILGLMIIRIVWALINTKPSPVAFTPMWQVFLERLVHWCLYLLLLVMPLAGWIGSVAAGHVPSIAGFAFNLPIAKNKELADLAFSTHNNVALIIIALVSLHVLAALYHHFIKKDNVLMRMWPGSR